MTADDYSRWGRYASADVDAAAPSRSPWGADASADLDEEESASAGRVGLWGEGESPDEDEYADDVELEDVSPEAAVDVEPVRQAWATELEDVSPEAAVDVQPARQAWATGEAEESERPQGVPDDVEAVDAAVDAVEDVRAEAPADDEPDDEPDEPVAVQEDVPAVETVVGGAVSTGHEAVDAAVRAVENAARLPVGEQLAAYEAAHTTLREVLASIEE